MTNRDKLLKIQTQIEEDFANPNHPTGINEYSRQMTNIQMALNKYPLDDNNNNDEYIEKKYDK